MDLTHFKERAEQTLLKSLGIEITVAEKGRVEATMPVDHRTHQPFGLLHGGASVALAESIASIGGALLVMEQGKVVVGQEINANHIRSVKSGVVHGIGEPIHVGKTSQVWQIHIYNQDKKLVCVSRCTLAVVDL